MLELNKLAEKNSKKLNSFHFMLYSILFSIFWFVFVVNYGLMVNALNSCLDLLTYT